MRKSKIMSKGGKGIHLNFKVNQSNLNRTHISLKVINQRWYKIQDQF